MAPPIVYYVRHGETDWNVAGRLQGRRNIPLNARGRAQAAVAEIFCVSCLRAAAAALETSTMCRARSNAPAKPWN